jgi:hypothetical protein
MLITYPNRVPEEIAQHLRAMGISMEIAQQWWEEYQRRDAAEFHAAVAAQHAVSQENFGAAHRPIDGLGQAMFRIAEPLARYLYKHWGEYSLTAEFRTDLMKKHPEFCFRPQVQQLSRIIHPGLNFAA